MNFGPRHSVAFISMSLIKLLSFTSPILSTKKLIPQEKVRLFRDEQEVAMQSKSAGIAF